MRFKVINFNKKKRQIDEQIRIIIENNLKGYVGTENCIDSYNLTPLPPPTPLLYFIDGYFSGNR